MAPATHMNVPVSIRSGMMLCSAPCKALTPLMIKRSVPRPWMLAPILISNSAKSVTSGSRAAFSKTVSPSAKTAAIIKFSVPVTVIMSVKIFAPTKAFGFLPNFASM